MSLNPSATHCCEVDHSEHNSFEQTTGKWDRIGIFLSSLCAIHCLLTPLIVLALPFLGSVFEHEFFHVGMALFIVPVGLFAFWTGYKHHKETKVFTLGCVGVLMVGIASLLPHEWVEFFGYDVVTIIGSLLLLVAHILNRRACLCHKH